MADEPQTPEPQISDTERPDTNPATENQPGPSVVTVYDRDGREHFAAPTSKFVVDGLADGTLSEEPAARPDDSASSEETPSDSQAGSSGDAGQQQSTEEAPGGAETGSGGDDPQPGPADGGEGSGDGTPEAGGTRRGRRAGQA